MTNPATDTVQTEAAEIERLKKLVHVPGLWNGFVFDGRKRASTQISLCERGLITCIVTGGSRKPRAFITPAGRRALSKTEGDS